MNVLTASDGLLNFLLFGVMVITIRWHLQSILSCNQRTSSISSILSITVAGDTMPLGLGHLHNSKQHSKHQLESVTIYASPEMHSARLQ